MRQGILIISDGVKRDRARAALPAGHTIVATKHDLQAQCEHWLIEGPHMPEVPKGAEPPEVQLVLTMTHPQVEVSAQTPIVLTARWAGAQFDCFGEWTVKQWADNEGFQAYYA